MIFKPETLIQSRFRGVYLGLFILWITSLIGFHVLYDRVIEPKAISSKIEEIVSLIRTHNESLKLFDSRVVRTELIQRGIIKTDSDFEVIQSTDSHATTLKTLLSSCSFQTNQSCLGGDNLLIFSNAVNRDPLAEANFIVQIKTEIFHNGAEYLGWFLLTAFIFASLLGIIGYGVRHQEKFLLEKTKLLFESLSHIERSFSENSNNQKTFDEFEAITKTVDRARIELETRAGQVETYKEKFKRRARLEQLAQTISHTTHDLKAPLEETLDFLGHLPHMLEGTPKERILKITSSLEKRVVMGLDSIDKALGATKTGENLKSAFTLAEVLNSISNSVKRNSKFSNAKVSIENTMDSVHLLGDAGAFERALFNLIINSVEEKADCEITVKTTVQLGTLELSFEDNGPGIHADRLEIIFDDFVSFKKKNSGLGLSSVKNCIAAMGGAVRAVPSNTGAHFLISLPIKDFSVVEGPNASA